MLEHMTGQMIRSGMYARPTGWSRPRKTELQEKDFRYRIARWLFNIERGSCGSTKLGEWTNWLRLNGFNWNFHKICAKGQMADKKVG